MMQNIKPSTRAFIQFVSPNANYLGRIIQIESTELQQLLEDKTKIQLWEEQEICALAILNPWANNQILQNIQQLKSILSCPVIVLQDLQSDQELYRLREIDADAVITHISVMTAAEIEALQAKAQAMNLLLIPHIQNEADWQKMTALNPRFIFVENSFDFLQKVPNQTWLIGSQNFQGTTKLKCRFES